MEKERVSCVRRPSADKAQSSFPRTYKGVWMEEELKDQKRVDNKRMENMGQRKRGKEKEKQD